MKNKIHLVLLVLLGVLVAVGVWQYYLGMQEKQEVHYHAGFLVYKDGVLQDYSDTKYMQIRPCGDHTIPVDEQIEKAHLHDFDDDVVHVHREGAKWKDLFQNIHVTFPSDKLLKAFKNGQEIPGFPEVPIVADESIVIVSGSAEGIELNKSVTLDRIRQVETKSESCGT